MKSCSRPHCQLKVKGLRAKYVMTYWPDITHLRTYKGIFRENVHSESTALL